MSEMSKRILKGLMVFIVVLSIMLVYMSMNASIKAFDKEEAKNYNYHFQVVVDKDMNKKNREELIDGCLDASTEHNAYIEIIEATDNSNKAEIVDKAIYAKVDGIAYNAEVQSVASELAKKARDVDIPVVNYGMSAYNDENIYNIHTTPYDVAKIVALDAKKLADKKKIIKHNSILVFLKECDEKDKKINNRLVKGFLKGISSEYKKNVKFVRVDAEGYDVNSKLKSHINNNKNAKIVVCFDEEYTNAASSIYSNKYKNKLKDKITLIGYGITASNEEDVKLGIIKYLFSVNKHSLGYNAVNGLVAAKKNNDIDLDEVSPIFRKVKLSSKGKIEFNDIIL